ncbi:unnamed protein product [Closterium sp. NIES-54]
MPPKGRSTKAPAIMTTPEDPQVPVLEQEVVASEATNASASIAAEDAPVASTSAPIHGAPVSSAADPQEPSGSRRPKLPARVCDEEDKDDMYLSDDSDEGIDLHAKGLLASKTRVTPTLLIPHVLAKEVRAAEALVRALLLFLKKLLDEALDALSFQELLPTYLSRIRHSRLQVTFASIADAEVVRRHLVDHVGADGKTRYTFGWQHPINSGFVEAKADMPRGVEVLLKGVPAEIRPTIEYESLVVHKLQKHESSCRHYRERLQFDSGGVGPGGTRVGGACSEGAGDEGADTGDASSEGIGAEGIGTGGASSGGVGAMGTGPGGASSGGAGIGGTGTGRASFDGAGVSGTGVGGAAAAAAATTAPAGTFVAPFPSYEWSLEPWSPFLLFRPLSASSCLQSFSYGFVPGCCLSSSFPAHSSCCTALSCPHCPRVFLTRLLLTTFALSSSVLVLVVLCLRLFSLLSLSCLLLSPLLLSFYYYRTARPVVSCVLTSLVTDPHASPSSVSALTATVADFAATRRLDYATRVVAAPPTRPLSARDESALGYDILEDRQFELEFLAAASPHLGAMLLAPKGDPDVLEIPTPRT